MHSLFLDEAAEELRAIDAVEGSGSPVQDFDEAQCSELARLCGLMKELSQHGHAKVMSRGLPVEIVSAQWILFVPENPRGKHAVEEGLHQSGTEEMFASP